jgi:hypothetical protein
MRRYAVFLRRDQLGALKTEQARTGAPASELIRRAIDAALGTTPRARRRP